MVDSGHPHAARLRWPLVAFLLLLTSATSALAQTAAAEPSCGPRITVEAAFEQADLVVEGLVLESHDFMERQGYGDSAGTWHRQRVVVRVLRGWKGQPRDTIHITTPPPDEDSATVRFEPGQLYVLYLGSFLDSPAYRRGEGIDRMADLLLEFPRFMRCSRTGRLADATEDLEFLGEARWVRP